MAKEMKRMIESRLGPREISEEAILNFPRGLIGFDDHREFTLLPIREDSPFLVLQSLSDPKLGLLVTDPYNFMEDYDVKIGMAEKKILRIRDREQVGILVTVSIPQGSPENTSLNLAGPIVVNAEEKVGLQVPQTDANYPSRYRPNADKAKK